MNRVGSYAYLHGKLHGMIAKSFLEDRFKTLQKLASLSDVYRALFPNEPLEVSEKDLVTTIQRKHDERLLQWFLKILDLFPSPPPLLIHLVRRYEIRNVKTIFRRAHSGVLSSVFWNLKRYGSFIPMEGEPAQVLKNTSYAYLIELAEKKPLWALEFELDEQYYRGLLKEIQSLPGYERSILLPPFLKELELINIVWALRLRYFYRVSLEDTLERMFLKETVKVERTIQELFDLPWDEPERWRQWRYGWLVGTTPEGKVDPVPADWRSTRYQYSGYRKLFYHHPFTLAFIYGFFRMKEYEGRLVNSVTEGIHTGVSETELQDFLESV